MLAGHAPAPDIVVQTSLIYVVSPRLAFAPSHCLFAILSLAGAYPASSAAVTRFRNRPSLQQVRLDRVICRERFLLNLI